MGSPTRKRGQVTLFIILGIIIISAILAFVFWVRPTGIIDTSRGPQFDSCVQDAVEQGINDLGKKAGYLTPEFTYPYKGEHYTYLCYTNEYYETCVVQQPFIKQNYEKNLERHVREQIDVCYENALDELRSQGYGVQAGSITYDITFEPSLVIVSVDAPTTVGSQSFKTINVQFNSPIYDQVFLATSILQSEATYGDANTNTLMIYHPDFIVDKMKQSDGTTLYSIENKLFNTKFNFASRSLAWPPGYPEQ